MLVRPSEMKAAEEAAFARGIEAEALMEEAGAGIARVLEDHYPTPGRLRAYLGTGHNAGDALVVARLLTEKGWHTELRFASSSEDKLSPLTRKKLTEYQAPLPPARTGHHSGPLILLDGLLGIGARGPLRGPVRDLTREMNTLRDRKTASGLVAIDLPTGLDGETGQPDEDALRCDLTITLGFGKIGLVADTATPYVGRLAHVPLPAIPAPESAAAPESRLITPGLLRPLHLRRPVDCYKTQAGRVAIVAGSVGLTGAAELAARGALTAGAGLVSIHVPEAIYGILAGRCPAEIMVRPVAGDAWESLAHHPADGLVIGPGLGSETTSGLTAFLEKENRPVVLDADALNHLARNPERLAKALSAGPRLLTPHPGEFARLFPQAARLPTRLERARQATSDVPITLLLKGARSLIAEAGKPVGYNTTGHPGMATGGMGDVLSGICGALVAGGSSLHSAACLGSWLLGRGAEKAILGGESGETLTPSSVIQHLNEAFRSLESPLFT
ncbi:MAG: NAD(P)H-hydrate dehydratase [Verrucomicrobiota bacterium]